MDYEIDLDNAHTVTSGQLRAARALLGWSRDVAAVRCGVGSATLSRIEKNKRIARDSTIVEIVRTFQEHGIRFLRDAYGPGVSIREA